LSVGKFTVNQIMKGFGNSCRKTLGIPVELATNVECDLDQNG